MEMTIEQALQQGVAAHKEGKLEEAERLYRAILQSQPAHPEANHNLGVIAVSVNKVELALPLFKTAIEANPKIEQFWLSYIEALIKETQLETARVVLEQGTKMGLVGDKVDALEAQLTQIAVPLSKDAEAEKDLGNTLLIQGKLQDAEVSYRQAIFLKPDYAEAHSNLGATLQRLDRLDEAEASLRQAISLKPDFAGAYSNLGITLEELGRLDEAVASYKKAIALKPDFALAHSNLGNTLKQLGRSDEAEASYTQAITLNPDYASAHSNLAITLITLGRTESALHHFERGLQLKRGAKPLNLQHRSFINISKAKIEHDIEQFEYLASSGYDIKKFRELSAVYRMVSSEINWTSDAGIVPLSDKHQRLIGDTYNRPFHILEASSDDESPIGNSLNVKKITDDYFSHDYGLTYIDDFLSPSALESLRNFLLGSTIWFQFFHAGGYMGAYLKDGLASPLILQIAEDLRKKFPKIFKYHKLTQLWAFKYDNRTSGKNNSFKGINVHADFAAINVNFWITPNSANLDQSSGGLVVYNSEAPSEWSFNTYNNNEEKIREEILKSDQKKTIVPHNGNRAVIFNSNLFHETDAIDFKDGYENRRINVTMLFGKREL